MTFDEYSDAVRDADMDFVLTHRETLPWRLDIVPSSAGLIQIGTDGGGSISEGIVRPDKCVIIFRTTPSPHPVLLDGEAIEEGKIVVLGPSSHFTFSSGGARGWMAVSLSTAGSPPGADRLADRHRQKLVVPDSAEAVAHLVQTVEQLGREDCPATERAELDSGLVATCSSILAKAAPPTASLAGEDYDGYLRVVHAAIGHLRRDDVVDPSIGELCSASATSERSLLRAFHCIVQMGPKRYLRLRKLNLVRRAFRRYAHRDTSLTQIFGEFGVGELGRFAGEYKTLFGELPSESLNRFRARAQSGQSLGS